MSAKLTFSSEVLLISETSEGLSKEAFTDLRIECPETFCPAIQGSLANAGLKCSDAQTKINGTTSISNWVEFRVSGSNFNLMKSVVFSCLLNAGVRITEYSFTSVLGTRIQLNLDNVSVFDKKSHIVG